MTTRRQLLRSAAATTLIAPLARAAAKKKVLIIGAGIGGLSCGYDLVQRGHDVTILEASRRAGGHVKTIQLDGGLYADVGAEHFTNPGYDAYRHWVEHFKLDVIPYKRRRNMYRRIDGTWYTEQQLADPAVVRSFGFNEREVSHILEHGWTELSYLYFKPMADRFHGEYEPFSAGLDELDHVTLGDWLHEQGASPAGIRFIGGRRTTAARPATKSDVSALFRIWQSAIMIKRGLPNFKREVFRLKGGNQTLPDTFAKHLGDRIHLNCPITKIERHASGGASVHFTERGEPKSLDADIVVLAVSPAVLPMITVTPDWPEPKAYALRNTVMGMQCRVLIQASRRFWEGDPKMPSINLETGDAHMGLVYQTADEVPGDRCVLMGSGPPYETPEDTLKAFRAFYPGSPDRLDAIEKCIIHSWVKEEPYAHGCERHAWGLGELKKIWPHFIQPVGNIHFVGSAYDALPWGQDAATRSAARVAQLIDESV